MQHPDERLTLKEPHREAPAETAAHGVSIEEILPGAVPGIWHHVEGMIRQALNASEVTARCETPQDVKSRCEAGDYALWLILAENSIKAALIVSVENHPRCNIATIHYCAGSNIEHWMAYLHDYLTERGRNAGCRYIKIEGRDGWGRMLKSLGFKKTSETFTKEI